MRLLPAIILVAIFGTAAHAQNADTPPQTTAPATASQTLSPATAPPAQQTPQTPGGVPGAPSPATPPVVGATPAPAVAARAFTAPVGMLFHTVRPERVTDFEKAVAYLQAALQQSTDPRVQAQARGWRMYKASEPGPNGTVLYAFVMDPTVPGADYALGPILAAAYPDMPQLQEIWRLYTGAVTSGGTLLNLTPLAPKLTPAGELDSSPTAPTSPGTANPAAPAGIPGSMQPTPAPKTSPLDTNPNVPGGPGR